MTELVALAAILASFYVAWNIGANDTANAMGTAVGAQIISYRRALTLLIVFVLLGALIEGYKVMGPVGKEILRGPVLSELPWVVATSMLCAGLVVTLATKFGFPVSTHHAIVGALAGAGVAVGMFKSEAVQVNWWALLRIAGAWVITPFGAAIFAFALYKIFEVPLRKIKAPARLDAIFVSAVIISGCYLAYVMGANNVGTAMGAIYATGENSAGGEFVQWLALFGAAALAIGALAYSRKVVETVGMGITPLGPMTAFVAQFGAALTVHMFTQFGLPVSTSQAIVGGVVGAGLVRGTAAVSGRKLGEIVITWISTPTVSMFLAFSLTSIFLWV